MCNVLISVQKHNDDTIKTNGDSSLEKYTSHTLFELVRKGYEKICVRGELETEERLQLFRP